MDGRRLLLVTWGRWDISIGVFLDSVGDLVILELGGVLDIGEVRIEVVDFLGDGFILGYLEIFGVDFGFDGIVVF